MFLKCIFLSTYDINMASNRNSGNQQYIRESTVYKNLKNSNLIKVYTTLEHDSCIVLAKPYLQNYMYMYNHR